MFYIFEEKDYYGHLLKEFNMERCREAPWTPQESSWKPSAASMFSARHCLHQQGSGDFPQRGFKQLKHLLRYIKGTLHSKMAPRPSATLPAEFGQEAELRVFVDANWAGCPSTRKALQEQCFSSSIVRATSWPRHRV